MKKIFFLLSIALIAIMGYVVLLNMSNIIDVYILKGVLYTFDAENPYVSLHISAGFYTGLIIVIGAFIGAGLISLFLWLQSTKIKAYKRELEKSSITSEESASKVKVLEAKIKTLENAFDSVVDERTQLEVKIKSLNAEIESLKN